MTASAIRGHGAGGRASRTRGPARRAAVWALIFVTALLALKGLIVVSQFIGYASFAGEAGTITELIIQHELPTDFWAAVYGVAVRVGGYTNQQYDDFTAGDMEEMNLLFDCMEKDIQHEVYATHDDPAGLDTSNLFPMTAAEIDAYYGKNATDFDSAINTYTQPVSFQFGSVTINTVGTVTYKLGESPPTTFQIAITKTSDGTPVYVALVTNFTDGFNGRLYNYQLMFPAPYGVDTRYYFWTDPNDICPEGEGEEPNKGVVYGQVTSTNGLPVEGVIVDVAGVTNLTNATGWYSITTAQGDHNIFAIKTGYQVYQNNVTVTPSNLTRHDIILEEEKVPNDNTGIGPGQDVPGDDINPYTEQDVGPGEDEGPGEAPIAPMVQQPKVIEGEDYIVSLNEINRKLRIGQFVQERIFVYSFKKIPASVTLRVNGTNISRLIKVDATQVTVEPNGRGVFVLTIFGVEPIGVFNGTIELEGDLNASIPVRLEILPKEQLPVEALHVEVETAEKEYLPNDVVRVTTNLRNMLIDQQYPVRLVYTVQNPEGDETIWTYETNVFVQTSLSLIKSFQLPSKTPSGDYILRVTAYYLSLGSGTSTIFHVSVPFWQRSFLGMKYWLWLLILLLLGGLVGAGFAIKHNIDSKKKYHLKVEYDELPKPGPRSIYVGKIAETDHTTYFNLENFKTHTIVAGSTGGGKSVSAQVIVEEALDKGVAILVFDPTAQWTGMLRPCKDKMMLALYPLFGMKKGDAKAFSGNIRQINDAREKIDIRKYVKPGEIQVFACHKLDPKDMDILVANAIREIFHAGFDEQKLLRIMFVFDEVHRLLPKFGGSGDGFLQIERACREFRKWGLGVLLISQVLSDFVGTIKANINTEIQMRTRDEGDLERIRQKYGEEVLRSLVKATVGSGMVENPAYNRGKPYFIAFKPLRHSVERLSDEEIEQYNTYNDQIDDLFFSLEQLEQEGVDVFDLKLELKLALDKVKTGSFNMVKIYLEGLKPRIDKQWEKIGKQPKKLVRELVDIASIQAELKKAQQERDKYVAEREKEQGPVKGEAKKEWGWKDDVTPDRILNLKNGMIVINLASLYDEMSAMKDDDLKKEFDPEPELVEGQPPKAPINRFAAWVRDAIGDAKLANNLFNAKTKEEMLALLDTRKNGGEIKDVAPPPWAGSAAPAAPAASAESTVQSAPASAATAGASSGTAPSAPGGSPQPAATPQSPPPVSSPAVASSAPASPPSTPPVGAAQTTVRAAALQPTAPPQSPSRQPLGWEEDVPIEEIYNLQNGMIVINLASLYDELMAMADADFVKECNLLAARPYNLVAEWVRDIIHDQRLANAIAVSQTKDEILQLLERRRDGVALPDLEPPAWFAGEIAPKGASPAVAPTPPTTGSSPSSAVAPAPVSQAKSLSSLDLLVVPDERQAFRLENGVALHGVKELKEYLPKMDEETFRKHVGFDYNHFADWISGVFKDEGLAHKVASARTREDMVAALSG